jgi:hypothetical protein
MNAPFSCGTTAEFTRGADGVSTVFGVSLGGVVGVWPNTTRLAVNADVNVTAANKCFIITLGCRYNLPWRYIPNSRFRLGFG